MASPTPLSQDVNAFEFRGRHSRSPYVSRSKTGLSRMSRSVLRQVAIGRTRTSRTASVGLEDKPAGCIVAPRDGRARIVGKAAAPWPALADCISTDWSSCPGIRRFRAERAARGQPPNACRGCRGSITERGTFELPDDGGPITVAVSITSIDSGFAPGPGALAHRKAATSPSSANSVGDARHTSIHLDRLRGHARVGLQRGHRRGRPGPR